LFFFKLVGNNNYYGRIIYKTIIKVKTIPRKKNWRAKIFRKVMPGLLESRNMVLTSFMGILKIPPGIII